MRRRGNGLRRCASRASIRLPKRDATPRKVLATAGQGLDAQGRALLEEDLRSPCTEEIAVFRAFADTVAQGADQFVVIDTAPTGHTLLLLDAAEAYHREVLRKASGTSDAVQRLLPRLRDPQFTMVLLVTLPEATPIHEAMQLERDLARADITPFAWVVNQSLTPLDVTDPVLRARRNHEAVHLRELAAHGKRTVARTVARRHPRCRSRWRVRSTAPGVGGGVLAAAAGFVAMLLPPFTSSFVARAALLDELSVDRRRPGACRATWLTALMACITSCGQTHRPTTSR